MGCGASKPLIATTPILHISNDVGEGSEAGDGPPTIADSMFASSQTLSFHDSPTPPAGAAQLHHLPPGSDDATLSYEDSPPEVPRHGAVPPFPESLSPLDNFLGSSDFNSDESQSRSSSESRATEPIVPLVLLSRLPISPRLV